MSSRRRRLVVQPDAQPDIRAILLYTREHWSAAQRRRYRAQLNQGMRSLFDHPERGRARDEFYAGCRSLMVEQHVIYYYLTDDAIVVDRVLHGSQDPADKLAP